MSMLVYLEHTKRPFMIKTAGVAYDFYDDGGSVLRKRLGGNVPEFIKTAAALDDSSLASLPDHAFALVLFNGTEQLRKFACVDKGNTAASVVYFMENREKLPKVAQERAAQNLVNACLHYDLLPPLQLMKIAGKANVLIKGDGAEILTAPTPAGEKTADLSGTSLMPQSPNPEAFKPRKKKLAFVISDPYVDVTASYLDPVIDHQDYHPGVYAMTNEETGDHSFPLVTYEHVKTAAAFFDEQGGRLHPRTRRTFCVKVAARANKLGIEVSPEIQKYGGRAYARDGELDIAVEQRRQMWRDHHDEAVSLLDGLMEKKASVDPDTFAETLAQLDIAVGSDRYWDTDLFDPWYATFGINKEAQEEAPWRWQQGTEYLTEEQLKRLTAEHREGLSQRFGEQLANGLAKNPVSIFESLPLEQKRVIARMAQQQDSGL